MLRILRPGPIPDWLPLVPEFSHQDHRQSARIGCWAVVWNRDDELWVRPIFGGALIVLECAGATAARVVNKAVVGVKTTPLIPLATFQRIRILHFGEVATGR